MNYFLMKRNPEIGGRLGKKLGSTGEWYVNTKNGGWPSLTNTIYKGDIVYLYEADYAIWGKGIIEEIIPFGPLKKIEEVFIHIENSNLKNESYWGQQLITKVWPNTKINNLNFFVCEIKLKLEILDSEIG